MTYFCSYLEHRIWRSLGYKAHSQWTVSPIHSSTEASMCLSSHLCSFYEYLAPPLRRYSLFVFYLVVVVCSKHQICIKKPPPVFPSKANGTVWVTAVIPKRAAAYKNRHPGLPSWHSKAALLHQGMHLSHQQPDTQKQPADSGTQERFTDILHGGCFSATVLGSTPGGSIRWLINPLEPHIHGDDVPEWGREENELLYV